MAKILLAEDEVNIASFIERGLKEFGHEVRIATNGAEAWEILRQETFDLLILDLIMPRMNGLELCAAYRSSFGYSSPVIMLTALDSTDDIVKGLEAGADDYLSKPFIFRELEVRIRALLRRRVSDTVSRPRLVCGDLSLDPSGHRAVRGGQAIDLTVREYRLLEYLLANQGSAVSRPDIIRRVWDKEADRNMNIVDVYVNYLRIKIDKGFDRKIIHTVPGVGYRLEA
ncbi:MAG: response regulator transcription factor [Tannerellaceae bacterium]|jgi:DNA-binding response OmpR family regulator|nr:response regulator transcription factor [Tannerellaceae bacterium]